MVSYDFALFQASNFFAHNGQKVHLRTTEGFYGELSKKKRPS